MEILASIIISFIVVASAMTFLHIMQGVACNDCKLKHECEKHKEETGRTYCEEDRMTRITEQNLFHV